MNMGLIKMTEDKISELIEEIPKPDAELPFSLSHVGKMLTPHPYCITPRHVEYASDHFGGILSEEAIREAEKNGIAVCDICLKQFREHLIPKILPYDEHKERVVLFISVPDNSVDVDELKKLDGLEEYLVAIKPKLEELHIDGVAFVKNEKNEKNVSGGGKNE